MGALRAHLHQQLKRADVRGRDRLLYPHLPDVDAPLNVHSKVLVVDNELCSIGSANFNNRSMGFDTERNIAIEAHWDPRVRGAIAGYAIDCLPSIWQVSLAWLRQSRRVMAAA